MPDIYERVLNKWDGMMMMMVMIMMMMMNVIGYLHSNILSLNRSNLNKNDQSV